MLISNYVEHKPGPCRRLDQNLNIYISSFNASSIVNKIIVFQPEVTAQKIDIIAITETWLNANILD